jgi:prepilin-type processing-associated H-X9-DG protein
MYFADWEKPPALVNKNDEYDFCSQYNYSIWRNTPSMDAWVNAGVLHAVGHVQGPDIFTCPTYVHNYEGQWWSNDPSKRMPIDGYQYPNPWPEGQESVDGNARMTYGTRRMLNYGDRDLSDCQRDDPADDHIQLVKTGLDGVRNRASFSYMADNFHYTKTESMLSHVPGVNVLYADWHVGEFVDTTAGGEILYDNGITGWGRQFNWLHDDIWMIIDGYHQPPVGQGQ